MRDQTMTSRMFPFVTRTWNPLGGECLHKCVYCWARKLAAEKRMAKYIGKARLIESEMHRRFSKFDFVFVCDMCDWLGRWVPAKFEWSLIEKMNVATPTEFLSLTKNPEMYMAHINWGSNIVLGSTIESDRDYDVLSAAPSQFQRLYWMTNLAKLMRAREEGKRPVNRLFVSIEPILDFDLHSFSNVLANWIKPWAVAVGYDNYSNYLPEPPLAKTMQLIEALEKAGIKVYRKTLREAWNLSR